jgi:hypothetical protein
MSVSFVTHQLCSQSLLTCRCASPRTGFGREHSSPRRQPGRAKASTARLPGRCGRSPNCGRTNAWQHPPQARTGWSRLPRVIGSHPGPGWRISMQRGGRTSAAAYRGARPGDGPTAAADRRPTQSGAALRRNGPEPQGARRHGGHGRRQLRALNRRPAWRSAAWWLLRRRK